MLDVVTEARRISYAPIVFLSRRLGQSCCARRLQDTALLACATRCLQGRCHTCQPSNSKQHDLKRASHCSMRLCLCHSHSFAAHQSNVDSGIRALIFSLPYQQKLLKRCNAQVHPHDRFVLSNHQQSKTWYPLPKNAQNAESKPDSFSGYAKFSTPSNRDPGPTKVHGSVNSTTRRERHIHSPRSMCFVSAV